MASNAPVRRWIQDGARRRRRSEVSAAATFGAITALVGLAVSLASDAGLAASAVTCGLAFVAGVFIVMRRSRGIVPRYVRAFAEESGYQLAHRGLAPNTPILQQPFSRTYGVASGTVAVGEHRLGCAVAAYDYVRRARWHLETLVRVHLRIGGEPEGLKLAVATVDLPQTSELLPVLLCERRYGTELLDPIEDAARRLERLGTESEGFDRHREVFVLPEQDPVWLRRLFSPAFVDWHLRAGHGVAWELVDGQLASPRSAARTKAASSNGFAVRR